MSVIVPLLARSRARLAALAVAAILCVPLGTAAAQGDAGSGPDAAAPAAEGASRPAHAATTRTRRGTRRRTLRHVRAAAPAAPRYTTPRGEDALTGDLRSMLFSRVRSGKWGVMVVSLSRGDTLFDYAPDSAMQPASNMKLFTTAIALDQFGENHQFSTDVLRAGTLGPDGTLHGDLILRGDGDPALSPRFFDGGPGASMDLLAQLVAGAGVKHVTGRLIADASAFDTQRIPEGWQSRYLQSGYAARVSALSLNENLVWVVVTPGRNGKAVVTLEPATDIPLSANVRTTGGSGARVLAHTTSNGTIDVRGWIGARAGEKRYELVVEDPTAFTAGAFRRALAARGISVDGPTQFAATPAGAARVTSLASPPLARLISAMNRESINHYAELLFRDAGRHTSPTAVGSVETGSRLLQRFMTEKVGAAPGSVFAADGSGLSVLDHVTPRSLVQLLSYAHHAPWGDAFHASLPVAGESELLRRRMKYTPAQGNLHAKTGTTNTVISLGGYVTARDGELLAFAFIYNGTDRWNAKSTIDAMGATLAGFVR
ncbi:MAG TPA: D-alanyl-D-alanine carboxypeptidase/D-alanyl-D-alanine-endopeptidase [Gemmatimonadaceae bacterium]|nr:D-alanyl-D-alanine carboxypeptidase/D-alanyl-D-alanine-endopeptidase [Gemmatimonadaceae bacterium]